MYHFLIDSGKYRLKDFDMRLECRDHICFSIISIKIPLIQFAHSTVYPFDLEACKHGHYYRYLDVETEKNSPFSQRIVEAL
jgi:hypothetical protein